MKNDAIMFASLAAGAAAGYLGVAPQWLMDGRIPMALLGMLVFTVGVGLGSKPELAAMLRSLDPRLLLLPLFTIAGTLLFSAAAVVVIRDMSLRDCLAVGSGFGYYSLSSVLIADIKGTGADGACSLAAVALLANVVREMLSLFGMPLIARHFGSLASITAAGINSMDVCLPSIVRSTGRSELVPVAVVHGIVLEVSVPLLIMFFCR